MQSRKSGYGRLWHRWAVALLVGALAVTGGCQREVPPSLETAAAAGVRIVSLAPNLTEMLFAAGAGHLMVGRTDVCNWPPEVTAIPVVGSFGRPSLDAIMRQRPTLILTADLEEKLALQPLLRYGIEHHVIDCRKLDDIAPALRKVAALANLAPAGDSIATAFEQQLAALRAAVRTDPAPATFIEIWSDPLTTVGGTSFISELVTLAGYSNIASRLASEYTTISPEWVVKANPEVILCLYMTGTSRLATRVGKRLGWQGISAVQTGHIYYDFPIDTLFRPGPRVLQGVAALQRHLEKPYSPEYGVTNLPPVLEKL